MSAADTKIQIRSAVLRTLGGLRTKGRVAESDIENAVLEFLAISDKEFLGQVLVKEISGENAEFDALIADVLTKVLGEFAQNIIWKFLTEKNVSDAKKIFLINVLREMGANADYCDIASILDNNQALCDLETQKFIEMAKMNPEAQVDFLDFFFGMGDEDKTVLLTSMIDEFQGDELASLLVPIVYFSKDDAILTICINAFLKAKSYSAFGVLEWIIQNKGENLKHLASKTIKELKLSGLRDNVSREELYGELLKGSIPYGCWVSTLDGSSNFSFVFARERKNGTVQTFFVVINLFEGPVACFGFNEISKDEFDIVLGRFFKNTDSAYINSSLGVKILNESLEKALRFGKKVCYELPAWVQITYDVKTPEGELSDLFKADLSLVELGEYELKRIVKGNIVNNWFFKEGDNVYFDELLAEAKKEEKPDISRLEGLLDKYLPLVFDEEFNEKLLYQAYFVLKSGLLNIANILYSLRGPSEIRNEFLRVILKKSLYEHFLTLVNPCEESVKTFSKIDKVSPIKKTDVGYFLELIEEKWTT